VNELDELLNRQTFQSARRTVLIVDDEPASRETLKMAMLGWGYGVLTAHDGQEALSVFNREHPDLVIADVVMPRMDGIGLLRSIKESSPKTVVILLTAYGTINDAVMAIREGAADFLTKPIAFQRLKALVERSLRTRQFS
jgi:DNA-binding NtrC family response regulator